MNKKLLISLSLSLIAAFSLGQTSIGGNLPALRPGYTADDEKQFDLALSYIPADSVARAQTIFWETKWNPKESTNYRGIDAAIAKMAKKKVIPLFLLTPCPYPSSPWYTPQHNDWWLPRREVWSDVIKYNTEIVLHIQKQWKAARDTAEAAVPGVSTKLIARSSRLPLFQIWNEPEKGKPGGSNTSVYGEWTDDLHELLFDIATDLTKNGIPKAQLVGPAISCLGEDSYRVSAELLSAKPPAKFNWQNLVGYRAYHLRFGASWSAGNLTEVKRAFKFNMDNLLWVDSKLGFPAGQKLILTEWYVTPADCGVPLGTDLYPFHAIAFDILKKSPFVYQVAWGIRDGEADVPGNPWLTYGGVGKSLTKWVAEQATTNTISTGSVKDVKSGG